MARRAARRFEPPAPGEVSSVGGSGGGGRARRTRASRRDRPARSRDRPRDHHPRSRAPEGLDRDQTGRGRDRRGGDPHVIEQRQANEPLERRHLRFAPEAPDEATLEVHATADTVTIAIGGIGPREDRLRWDLGEQAHAEERRRRVRHVLAPLRCARHGVGREMMFEGDDERLLGVRRHVDPAVARGAAAGDGLLVAPRARRGVVVGPQALRGGESAERHGPPALEPHAERGVDPRERLAERREDRRRRCGRHARPERAHAEHARHRETGDEEHHASAAADHGAPLCPRVPVSRLAAHDDEDTGPGVTTPRWRCTSRCWARARSPARTSPGWGCSSSCSRAARP